MVMYAGKIVESGQVADVFTTPAHPYTEALLGSIPHRGSKLARMRGTVPSLIDYPRGCPFRERCDYQHELSAEVEPELRELSRGRTFACHLPKGVTDAAARTS
jgi:oligopeptide/dipeptide ABC transporter ATP-binding protein